MRRRLRLLWTLGGALLALFVWGADIGAARAENPGDIVVIVNKKSPIQSISVSELRRVFLKRQSTVSGIPVTPIHARKGTPLRAAFVQKVLGMQPQEEISFWEDQKLRTGTRPPAELSNTVKAVFSIKAGISYCYRKDFNPSVAKIVLSL